MCGFQATSVREEYKRERAETGFDSVQVAQLIIEGCDFAEEEIE
jgi:ribosomal protein S15P/S13E